MFGATENLGCTDTFGVVSVLETGTGTTCRIVVSGECLFFFFFGLSDTAPTRLRHASSEKKKSQILTDGLTNTIDFEIYPKTKILKSLRCLS